MIEHWAELHNNYCVHSNKAEDAKNELCVEIKQHLENFISEVRMFLDKTNIPHEHFDGCGVYPFDEGLFGSDGFIVEVFLDSDLVKVTLQKCGGSFDRLMYWRLVQFEMKEVSELFEKFPEWENKFLAMQDEKKI